MCKNVAPPNTRVESSNLTSATDPDGSYAITYDKLNRAETVNGPFGFNQSFGYDEVGNRITVSDNKGGSGTSKYDLANQLTSRTFTNGTTSARMDFASPRSQIRFGIALHGNSVS